MFAQLKSRANKDGQLLANVSFPIQAGFLKESTFGLLSKVELKPTFCRDKSHTS